MSLSKRPKIELNLHLEGAAPPSFIRGLARERHMDLGGLFTTEGRYVWNDYATFRKAHDAASSVVQSPEDHHRMVLAVLEESAANGVAYTEIYISPQSCGGQRDAWVDHVAAMREAAEHAQRRMGIIMRGIVAVTRHHGPDKARQSALCAAETAGDFILGLGLTGDETICDPKDFRWAFDCAREAGLRLACDAGERRGPSSIRDALRDLGPRRIGQGARAIEDLALVDELAEQGIVLDLCPGANIALGLYPGWRAHPAGQLYHRGVRITLSTAFPAFFGTTMTEAYDRLAEAFDWDEGVFDAIARTSLEAAFCDSATRARVQKRLETPDA